MDEQLEIESQEEEAVVKSNRLVKAKTPFTTLEHRIVAALIAQLDREQDAFAMQTVSLRRITEMSESNSTELFRRARSLCDSLAKKSIGIQTGSRAEGRTYRALPIFSECRYVEQKGLIKAEFNRKMESLLLRLKDRFTMYGLPYFLRLPSRHSMRIYELLKMREGLGALRISVGELREILSVEDKYEQFSTLKYHVLEASRERIAEHTDIAFTYDVERDGQTPREVRFFIHDQEEVPEGEGVPQRNTKLNYDTGVTGDLRFDVRTLFLQNRTQEEIESLDEETIEALYQRAHSRAQEDNPAGGKSVIASETLRLMEQRWSERS